MYRIPSYCEAALFDAIVERISMNERKTQAALALRISLNAEQSGSGIPHTISLIKDIDQIHEKGAQDHGAFEGKTERRIQSIPDRL